MCIAEPLNEHVILNYTDAECITAEVQAAVGTAVLTRHPGAREPQPIFNGLHNTPFPP